jgi:Xaa-Pro aminopeptidase
LSVAPLTEIVNALADAGIDHGRLGAEIGFEQRLGVPELEFQRICHAVAPRQIVDAADLLWSLRRLKASDEIAAMRRACQATARAYAEVLPRLRPGMAERQVVTRLKIAMLRHGGVDPWVSITSGASSYEIIAQPGSDRELQLGDMVWVDSGCQVSGYWSDFSRAAVLGAATCEQRDLQTAIHEATMAGVALARTGVPVAEIAAAAEERLQQLAVPITAHISGLAGRSGHGVGLDVTEPPSIAATDRSVLEAGMVITVEPGVATSFGTFHVEEQILVTDTKPDILSASPWALVETSRCVADSRGVT